LSRYMGGALGESVWYDTGEATLYR
jgi:hypothetical protein